MHFGVAPGRADLTAQHRLIGLDTVEALIQGFDGLLLLGKTLL